MFFSLHCQSALPVLNKKFKFAWLIEEPNEDKKFEAGPTESTNLQQTSCRSCKFEMSLLLQLDLLVE